LLRYVNYEDPQALRLLRKALEISPNFVPALLATAESLRLADLPHLAKPFYTKAINLDPTQFTSQKGLI
jgi:Tfp pilus assembly protein PilF